MVAWARGDTEKDSEDSCREVIARNHHWIKTKVTDWEFTVYASRQIQFQENTPPKALDVLPATGDDVPF